MCRLPTVVVTLGAVAATGAWGVRGLIQRGRAHQDPGLRQLTEAVADVEAGRRPTPVVCVEVPEGHSAVTWRNHLRAVLVRLFGAPARTTSEERGTHAR